MATLLTALYRALDNIHALCLMHNLRLVLSKWRLNRIAGNLPNSLSVSWKEVKRTRTDAWTIGQTGRKKDKERNIGAWKTGGSMHGDAA